MTRNEALRAAESCLGRASNLRLDAAGPEGNKSYALMAQALAETGRGYIELAKELRLGA